MDNKNNSQPSGNTKTFDMVKNKKEKKQEAGNTEKKSSKTSRAAKATASGALFVLRKVLTYTLNVLLTILIVGIITAAVVGIALIIYVKNYVDPNYTGLDNLKFDSSLSTTLYYVDDSGEEVLLEDDTLVSSENRMWADYADIPKTLIDAYIAVEDQRYFEHNGFDMTRTASAVYNFFIPTSSSYGGGSTITQQLIKNVSGEKDATMQRKMQEIFRAMNVEKKYTKEEILEMYLNTIYLSHNSYGVRVAAQTYFGKDLDQLTLAECASIASIGKWPSHYDPISNPKNNLTRRNLVLKLMLEQGKISEEEFNAAYDSPIMLADGSDESYTEKIHSYYIDAVLDDVVADLMAKYGYDKSTASRMLYSGGLQIITCLDPVVQDCCEKVFTDSSYWPKSNGIQAQSAIVIMDPETGDILGLVGGMGEKRESRGFNRATHAYRQCGSSIKPVSVYALAIETGLYNYGSPVDDVPPVYYENTGKYWPKNSDGVYRGLTSLDFAIQESLNTIATHTCELLGLQTVFDNLIKSGYTTLIESKTLDNGQVVSDLGLSPLALGGMTYGVTVRDHCQAYATLANHGISSKGRTYSVVRDSKGKTILDNAEKHEAQYSETTTAILTDLLKNVVIGPYGTGRGRIQFYKKYGVEVAGKTGTTNDKKDVYFCGYTPDFCVACWYGYDNNKVITTSGNCAAVMWNSVMDEIYKYYKENGIEFEKNFERPSSVVTNVEYCTISGKLATDACRQDACHVLGGGMSCIGHGTFSVYDVPTEYCDVHVMCNWDKNTKALCLDGCNCPAENIIQVGFRKMKITDRQLHGKVKVQDAQYTIVDLPVGYIFPNDKNVPYFNNLFEEDFNFGVSGSGRPANSLCIEHYQGFLPPSDNPEESSEATEESAPAA